MQDPATVRENRLPLRRHKGEEGGGGGRREKKNAEYRVWSVH